LLDIARMIWPAQSPDLNAIEAAWDYIRRQIKKREKFCSTNEEVIQAWEEEWAKIPVEIINQWIDSIRERLQKVIDSGGKNTFHG
jgi:transposase